MVMTNKSRWSKAWIGVISFLLPLSSFLVISCGNKPSEEECARAEQLIEAAHKAKDYKQLMQLADNLEAKGNARQGILLARLCQRQDQPPADGRVLLQHRPQGRS